jgi:hypothetical protein
LGFPILHGMNQPKEASMITWEHLRFLALMIPTWLLLGAVALTLSLSARDGNGTSPGDGMRAGFAACADPVGVAVQQKHKELVVAAEWDKEGL